MSLLKRIEQGHEEIPGRPREFFETYVFAIKASSSSWRKCAKRHVFRFKNKGSKSIVG